MRPFDRDDHGYTIGCGRQRDSSRKTVGGRARRLNSLMSGRIERVTDPTARSIPSPRIRHPDAEPPLAEAGSISDAIDRVDSRFQKREPSSEIRPRLAHIFGIFVNTPDQVWFYIPVY